MPINFISKNMSFHLTANNTSYVLQAVKDGRIAHIYWGKKIRNVIPDEILKFTPRSSFSPNPIATDPTFSLDTMPQEYPVYGTSDFRKPAFEVTYSDGANICDLRYVSHAISSGKPTLNGLPSTYCNNDTETMTLELKLKDSYTNLEVSLYYCVFEKYDAITRWAVITNVGDKAFTINRALSANIDFATSDFELLHLNGSWSRERRIQRVPIISGTMEIDSARGSSSHNHNPFIAILSPGATEDNGNAYGINLVYSGNFVCVTEVNQFNSLRVSCGINPFNFSWELSSGESFTTPEAVLVYSDSGIGKMSRTYHDVYRNHLLRGRFKVEDRPILINNWEATYFDFNQDKLESLAKSASTVGIELFVLDDGWFGKRNDDSSSLGDWFVNKEKLPQGLDSLGSMINNQGMKFGIWFEPEMISPNSELYRCHPDWCLHVPGRMRTLARNQLVLDFSQKEVREHICSMLENILENAPIEYVKWDMNRNMTEIGSNALPAGRQREITHRYMLGLYEILDKLTTAFPNVLFESCSGGGGRFDAGMLYYMPQTWTSDCTDAIERLKIQYGTSIVYPAITMGAHVSVVPNHQCNRITPLDTRGHVAMSGNLGYELDLTQLTLGEMNSIKNQVNVYKEIRQIVQFGDFFRILSPFDGNETAWMFLSKDKTEGFVVYVKVLSVPDSPLTLLKLKGLNPERDYKIIEQNDSGASIVLGGDMLMNAGLSLPLLHGDYMSHFYRIYML